MSLQPLVSVLCITYQQDKYLRTCIDSLLMQKTSFPYEILIHDDASTDNTHNILEEYKMKYPDKIRLIIQKENQYSKGIKSIIASFMLKEARGKYLAICEGDDYWIHPKKLQMQVDFLESHSDYGMCYTKSRVFVQDKKKIMFRTTGRKIKDYNDIYLNFNGVPTLTVCCRKKLYEKYVNEVEPHKKKWLMGDLPAWLWFFKNSKVYYLNKTTTMYRVLRNSASHSTDVSKQLAFSNSSYEIREFFANKYKEVDLLRRYQNLVFFLQAYNDENIKLIKEYRSILKNEKLSLKNRLILSFSPNPFLSHIIRKLLFFLRSL